MKYEFFNHLDNNDVDGLFKYLKIHDSNEEMEGQTLLWWSVFYNNLEFVKVLVNKGADINKKDKLNRTALLLSCYFGFIEIAKFLLVNGANTDGCLQNAKRGWDGHCQEEIIELLREEGEKDDESYPEGRRI
ncbi:ankyrin repeat domain-containing protein [Anaerobacillus isosaccharinicus]|uniref:Ankyrin repeat domain-containing protein n=1 Tax=Anaerobacillus isosaccharinicus TaxID=1532552 RepID=A0A1S2MD07_9BACI|nr:ankyrin repeat domain-containing protein [Anaerobacillus isosaccharinicus]MBA5587036.1 ankyrin repeat domain-containing protein [Anaerobacillus isosaccharinicus]QOY34765.1 ankyrin repeat domain-containing protein [Anaerobacillus isosaccharinicus]